MLILHLGVETEPLDTAATKGPTQEFRNWISTLQLWHWLIYGEVWCGNLVNQFIQTYTLYSTVVWNVAMEHFFGFPLSVSLHYWSLLIYQLSPTDTISLEQLTVLFWKTVYQDCKTALYRTDFLWTSWKLNWNWNM